MNKIKMLIGILSICLTGIASAQETEQKTNNIVTREIKIDLQKAVKDLKEKVLKNEVKKDSVLISFDNDIQTISISIDTNKVKLLKIEKQLNDKGYILFMHEIKIVKEVNDSIPAPLIEKYSPEIDKFLNIEDTTIFTSNFKTYGLQEIHPSRWNYYQVIQKIHDCGERLKRIENNLSSSKIDEVVKKIEISEEGAKKLLLEEAKNDIDKAEKDIDELLSIDINIFSPSQKQYYVALIDKFNVLKIKIHSK